MLSAHNMIDHIIWIYIKFFNALRSGDLHMCFQIGLILVQVKVCYQLCHLNLTFPKTVYLINTKQSIWFFVFSNDSMYMENQFRNSILYDRVCHFAKRWSQSINGLASISTDATISKPLGGTRLKWQTQSVHLDSSVRSTPWLLMACVNSHGTGWAR